MDYSEKDIEEYIIDYQMLWKEYGIEVLDNQFPTEYGVIDILGYKPKTKMLIVVELKKGTVDENAVGQIMRYMAAIKEMQEAFKNNPDLPVEIQEIAGVLGILMGTDATPGVHAIARVFNFIKYIHLDVMMQILPTHYNKPRKPESLTRDIDKFVNDEGISCRLKLALLQHQELIDTKQNQE